MRTLLFVWCALVAFLGPATGCDSRADDKQDMEVLVQTLDSCNNASDGNGILGIFTQSSFTNNDKLIKLALEGTEAQVKALHMCDRIEVLRMRLRATREELSKLRGQEYTRFATSRGWYVMPPAERATATLDRFRFNAAGDEAWAYLVHDGERSDTKIHFIKEGGLWRYDEPEAMIAYSRDCQRAARVEGMSENQYILMMLEEETGKEVPETVWQPMSAKEAAGIPLLPPSPR